jgi:hypothetical protein
MTKGRVVLAWFLETQMGRSFWQHKECYETAMTH